MSTLTLLPRAFRPHLFALTAALLSLAAHGQATSAWNAPSDANSTGGGLFLPVGLADSKANTAPASESARARRSAAPDAWERRVRIARHELTAARADVESTGAGRLLLNVRDGARLNVVVERTAPTKWGYSLSGRVAGGSVGFVTLVVHEEAVAGSVWTPDAAYELAYIGTGVHALRDVTNAPPIECGGVLPPELSAPGTSAQGATDDGSVVDVLVVWTPARQEKLGGEPQVLSSIEGSIAVTNDAFERSGALVTLRLVGAERVDYSETDRYAALGHLINPEDGHMDHVHDRRDVLGADLVFLAADVPGGIVGGGGAFGVGAFTHEFGHSFGLAHERYEPDAGVEGYNHGFTTRCAATFMSYRTECRHGRSRYWWAPFFASPWRYDLAGGHPVGVTRFSKDRGLRGPADAVLTLNRNRHRVANHRPGRN